MDQKIKRAVKCTSPLHGWSVAPPGKFKFFILAEAGRYGANDAYEGKHWRGGIRQRARQQSNESNGSNEQNIQTFVRAKKGGNFEKFCRSGEWK